MKITVLGLGRMGRELVQHVIDAGHDVTVWNRTPEACAAAVDAGARQARTAAEAVAGAEVVVTVLFGPETVRKVVLDGVDTFAPGTLWVDVTTVGPGDASAQAAWAAEREVRYVQSPVLGTLAPARARALGVLLGGAPDDVAAARTVTDLWADTERVFELATPERAAAGKLAVNLGLAVTMQALTESIRVGASVGMSAQDVMDLMVKTPLAGIAAAKGSTVAGGDYDDAQFTVDALAKDLGLVLDAAQPLPVTETTRERLLAAQDAGLGDSDFSVIADESSTSRAD
ncbi:MAG: NAD(P)-binding domain-containing protein [Aeromicrobium sp.]